MPTRSFIIPILFGAALHGAAILPAMAGGFSQNSGHAHHYGAAVEGSAFSTGNAKAKGKKFDFETTTYANTGVDLLYGGQIAEGFAKAGSHTKYSAKGKSTYTQKNVAKSKVYAKGKSIMAKARSSTHTTIHAGGKTYVVANEVARAMTRFTPLGTTAAADVETGLHVSSSGYIGLTTSTNSTATVRVAQ